METSESIKALSDALAKTQASITNPPKDGKGNYGKYATLESGLIVIREHLSANGISFTQSTRIEGDILILETRLSHGDQWMQSEYPVCKFPIPSQQLGSALTYSRRYSLFAMVGVAGDEDDDGNEANKSQVHAPARSNDGLLQTLEDEMAALPTLEDLDAWQAKAIARINKLDANEKDRLRKLYASRREKLNELEAAE